MSDDIDVTINTSNSINTSVESADAIKTEVSSLEAIAAEISEELGVSATVQPTIVINASLTAGDVMGNKIMIRAEDDEDTIAKVKSDGTDDALVVLLNSQPLPAGAATESTLTDVKTAVESIDTNGATQATVLSIKNNTDDLKGYVDGIEGLLTSIRDAQAGKGYFTVHIDESTSYRVYNASASYTYTDDQLTKITYTGVDENGDAISVEKSITYNADDQISGYGAWSVV